MSARVASAVAGLVAALWRDGAGPDDRRRVAAAIADASERAAAGLDEDLAELRVFAALIELAEGAPAPAPARDTGVPRSRALAASAAVWAAARDRDRARLVPALAVLERDVRTVAADDPDLAAVRGWADLALAEAALAAGDAAVARRRLEEVARGRAPASLRAAASLRVVPLLLARADLAQAGARCRQAARLAGADRPLAAHQARVIGALIAYVAGDRDQAVRALRDEAGRGGLGLLPRILLASLEAPAQAMALLAEGLADAGRRGDAFAYAMCSLIGARRYADLGRDGDALLTLAAAIASLRPSAPTFAEALDDQRQALRASWGEARHHAAEAAAIALLHGEAA